MFSREFMKLGIILYSNDPETVYQAFRLGLFALKKNDSVDVFFLAKGVECESLDNKDFNVTDQIKDFINQGGRTFTCTSCLKIRQKGATDICPLSTMADLYRIIAESDRVITL